MFGVTIEQMPVAIIVAAAMDVRLSKLGHTSGSERARSSAVEHTLHTGGVTGSIPVAPTMTPRWAMVEPKPRLTRPFIAYSMLRSEEHTSELQSLMRISYAVFCLKKKNYQITSSKTSVINYQL